jgi:hypothetical protein
MTNKISLHFPQPKDLWGDYTVEHWTRQQRGWFEIWLHALASTIIFAEQSTIDRVNPFVQLIIKQAKEGNLTYQDAVTSVRPVDVFTKEELEYIRSDMEQNGVSIGAGFRSAMIS